MNHRPLNLLITNGAVLTMDAAGTQYENGAVAIDDGRIVSIGPADAFPADAYPHTIDARGGIVMPGLVNTHTHLPMTIFRGLADDLALEPWLNDHIFPAEGKYVTADTVRDSTLLACAEMLLSGTTTCCDGYFHEEIVAEAVNIAGIRAVLAQGVIDFPAPGVPDPSQNIHSAEAFLETWSERSPLIRPSIFCHSPYTCSMETLKKAKAAANHRGCLFQIHVAETENEFNQIRSEHKRTPVQYLDQIGLLDENTLLIHTIWVDEKDIATIANRGAKVSVTTESEMKLGSGIAPIPGFLKAGISVGLGTDGCASNNDLDLFQEMDFTAKLHKVDALDPTVMDAPTVLKMATIGGANAIGWGEKIGSLEKGKDADIIIIDTNKPRLVPLYDATSHVVYAVNGSDVRDVIVAGRILVENRQLRTLDLETILENARRIGETIKNDR